MTSAVANYAARKLLGSQMDKYKNKKVAGADDPYFTTVPGRNGKPKKVKKQIPDFIPAHDAKVLAKVKKRAYHLDMSLFNLCGVRFGWSSVIGIVPAIGDVLDLFMAYKLFEMCTKVEGGLPTKVRSQMQFNILVDFFIGLVPFLGDLADALWRCNTKNASVLEKFLLEKYGPADQKAREHAGYEEFASDNDEPIHPPRQQQYQQTHQQPRTALTQTIAAPVSTPQGQSGARSWFGMSDGNKQQRRNPDEEMGGQQHGVVQ